jgi:hypothetical protein
MIRLGFGLGFDLGHKYDADILFLLSCMLRYTWCSGEVDNIGW